MKNPLRSLRTLFAVPLLAGLGLLPATGQSPPPAPAGQLVLNLHDLARHATKANQVTLSGEMLHSLAANAKDPQARALLAHLKGIYIYEFKFSHPGEYSRRDLRGIMRQLSAPGWQTVVHHRSADEQAWIAVRTNREGVQTALAILDAKPTELAVVNIVGPMPCGLGSLGALGALGDLGKLGNLGGNPANHAKPQSHPQLQPRPPTPAPAQQ